MEELKNYHHYREELIEDSDRVAKCEFYVMNLLLNSDIKEEERESSKIFEIKHHHSTAQFARLLARQRKLPEDICTIGALIHDIFVIKTGKYNDHAHNGAKMVNEILDDIGMFSKDEKEQIYKIVYNHSDKNIWSDDYFEEFGKDVDVLDCFLYPNGFGYYLKNKPLKIFYEYIKRAKKLWNDLNIPEDKAFSVLDNYNEEWFDYSFSVDRDNIINILKDENIPTFAFEKINENQYKIYTNKLNWGKAEKGNNFRNDNDYEKIIDLGNNCIVLIWNAISQYEVLNKFDSKNRIRELGIL